MAVNKKGPKPKKQMKKHPRGKTPGLYRLETCTFKRTKTSDWERGILLNEGTLGILDIHGKIPKKVWTWERHPDFAVTLDYFFNLPFETEDDDDDEEDTGEPGGKDITEVPKCVKRLRSNRNKGWKQPKKCRGCKNYWEWCLRDWADKK